MQQYFIILFLVTVGTSCVSDRPWYDEMERNEVSSKAAVYFAPTVEAEDYAMDSILYDKLLETGTSEYCALAAAFAMSEVKLERQLPNQCHAQVHKFPMVLAEMDNDTLTLIFRNKNLRRSVASNKQLKIKILDRDHHTQLIHWGTDYREIVRTDGSLVRKPSPSSEIIDTRLKLDKPYYTVGDTIIGEIKMTSHQIRGRRGSKIKEHTEGRFRAIVGAQGVTCELDQALATSWLK